MNTAKTILVATDFSGCSAAALRQAMRIATWNRAAIHVMHVLETLLVVDLQEALSVMQEDIVTAMRDDARKSWKEFASEVPGAADLPFEAEINSTIAALSRRVSELNAGLLVLGTHGADKPDGVGPVAAACVRRAPTDVLLVQDPHYRAYTTVIACIDFSDTSRRALDQAIRVATQDSATLYVINAYSAPWRKVRFGTKPEATADLDARYREMMLARLQDFCKPFAAELTYLKPRFQLVEHANHGHGIGQFARQIGADLVVLGTRGKTNLRDMLLGSTAERVLHDAPCSILAVKPA